MRIRILHLEIPIDKSPECPTPFSILAPSATSKAVAILLKESDNLEISLEDRV